MEVDNQLHYNLFLNAITNPLCTFDYGSQIRNLNLHNMMISTIEWVGLTQQLHATVVFNLEKIEFYGDLEFLDRKSILPTMQCLQEVVFTDCTRNVYKGLDILVKRAPRIQKLSLCGSLLNEGDLCSIISQTLQLNEITLGFDQVSSTTYGIGGDAFIAALVQFCPKVKGIDFTSINLTDTGMIHLLRKFGHQLRKIQLKRMHLITRSSLSLISHYCHGPHLRKLSFCSIPMMTDDILESIISQNQIEFLQLDSLPITDRGMMAVSNHSMHLKQLRMYDLKLLQDFSFISNKSLVFPVLKQFIVHGSPELGMEFNGQSIGAPGLERLELVGCFHMNESTLSKLVFHWKELVRFIYVGANASIEFQRQLKRKLPNCNSTIYVIGG